jgi:uncharacterized oxidoreductase
LTEISRNIFCALGVPHAESETVSAHLVEANLAGADSHGVLRIPQYVRAVRAGRVLPGAEAEILRESPSSALMDGKRGFGQAVGKAAMSLAIEKAGSSTISAVSAYNCGHTGRLASYTSMAVDRGMSGMMMVNAGGEGQSVAPFGGIQRRLATNPISCAIPTGAGQHIVLDMATSIAPEGKIRQIQNRGDPVPEGWMLDSQGRPTTDVGDFYGTPPGALLPLGGSVGHKGFGLALMVDILAGALSTAGCCRADLPEKPRGDGILAMAINISQFTPLDEFYQHVGGLVDHVKSSATAPGFDEILFPGEPEHRRTAHRLKQGIPLDESTWHQIREIADELGVSTAQ